MCETPETGTVLGALRIPRGIIEFAADDTHPMHNTALQKSSAIILSETIAKAAASGALLALEN